jgi:enoyl-CoA hydratase
MGGRPSALPYGTWYMENRELMFANKLRWRELPKPTIALVHGHCIYGGWMLASAMDLVFAADDAQFLGAHFEYFSIPWDIGVRATKELLFENRLLSAPEAKELGLVSRVVPRAALMEHALDYATRVARNDARGLWAIKRSANRMQDLMGFLSGVEESFETWARRVGPRPLQAPGSDFEAGRRRMTGVAAALRNSEEIRARTPPAPPADE